MSRVRQIAVAATTFSTAIFIGFFVQNNAAKAERLPADTVVAALVDAPVAPAPPRAPETSALATPAPSQTAAPRERTPTLGRPEAADAPGKTRQCDAVMEATVAPGAMVDLAIKAPCLPQTRATLHHRGMMITLITDDRGAAQLRMPALATDATYILAFGTAGGAITTVAVPQAAEVNRAVLQWQGTGGFDIHAYEFGAEFSEPGHVWRAAQKNPGGGFLVTLGAQEAENPLLAQVYTYPAQAGRSGEIALSVEAEVTRHNCGREVAAQSLQVAPDGDVTAVDLVMTMPGCDALSDIMILKNMFRDLTIASR